MKLFNKKLIRITLIIIIILEILVPTNSMASNKILLRNIEDTAKSINDNKVESRILILNKIIEVTEIKLDKSSEELEEGKTTTIKATIEPENATNKKLIYSSSNEKVAKVDNDGKVTAIKEGTATVTVKSSNEKKLNVLLR